MYLIKFSIQNISVLWNFAGWPSVACKPCFGRWRRRLPSAGRPVAHFRRVSAGRLIRCWFETPDRRSLEAGIERESLISCTFSYIQQSPMTVATYDAFSRPCRRLLFSFHFIFNFRHRGSLSPSYGSTDGSNDWPTGGCTDGHSVERTDGPSDGRTDERTK